MQRLAKMRREYIAPLLLLFEWRAVGRALKLLPRVTVDGHTAQGFFAGGKFGADAQTESALGAAVDNA